MSAVVAMAPITTGAPTLESQSYKPRANYKKQIIDIFLFVYLYSSFDIDRQIVLRKRIRNISKDSLEHF